MVYKASDLSTAPRRLLVTGFGLLFSGVISWTFFSLLCKGFQITVYTPSSRNCIFENLTFLKDLKINITMLPFCILKVLNSATKILKIG